MNTEDPLARSILELQDGNGSLDEFLAQHPNRTELEPLLRLALRLDALRDNPAALPSLPARARMRASVMNELFPAVVDASPAFAASRNGYHADPAPLLVFPTANVNPRRARWLDLGRRAAAMAASVAVLLATAGVGTVSAARDSLPGDLFYPVKTVTERAQVAFTFSDEERVGVYLSIAERRLWEMSRALDMGRTEAAGELAAAYDHNVSAASFATRAAVEGKGSLSVSQVEDQLGRQQQALQALQKRAPEPVQEAMAVALGANNQAASQISQTVRVPAPVDTPVVVDASRLTATPTIPTPNQGSSVMPQGGPSGGSIFAGPTATTNEGGFPVDKVPSTPTPVGRKGGQLPIATQPAVPTHAGDGGAPVVPVTAGEVPPGSGGPEQTPAAAAPTSTPEAAAASPSEPPAATASPTPPPAPSSTATAEKPGIISTPPGGTPTPVIGKNSGLPEATPAPRPFVSDPKTQ